MFVRSVRLALALGVAFPVAAVAQGFEYAPSTGQYRISSITKSTQEVMGQKNDFETSSNQLVSITVARASKDTLRVTAVIDSITMVLPQGMTPPGLEKLHGVQVVSKLSPHGVVYSSEGPKAGDIPNAEQLTDEMSRLLPRIPARLATGATWSDTVSGSVKQNGIDIQRQVVARFTVTGDTTVAGERSWKISREATTTLSGSGAPQGQPMTMEGTSAGKGTLFVSRKNVFVGALNEEQVKIKILLAANGMEIDLTQTANTTVEKVK